MVPAERIFGAFDGSWFHHRLTLTQSDRMLSVRAPDASLLLQFLGGSDERGG